MTESQQDDRERSEFVVSRRKLGKEEKDQSEGKRLESEMKRKK